METAKTIFNLHLTYEDALEAAQAFQASHKTDDGKELHIWKDPRNYAGGKMTFRADFFYKESTFFDDIKEEFEVGAIEVEAKAALFWLMQRFKGFNPLELGQIIVGISGLVEDKEVALFTYLSKEDDCMRDFIYEKAFELTNK